MSRSHVDFYGSCVPLAKSNNPITRTRVSLLCHQMGLDVTVILDEAEQLGAGRTMWLL